MKNEIIIQKLIQYAEKIRNYSAACPTFETFNTTPIVIEACVFNLSQMGELVNKMNNDFRKSHPEIPWKKFMVCEAKSYMITTVLITL
jgi:uncharacterized protein with HEPN domain